MHGWGILINACAFSNLTFGEGGKDKNGVVTGGWGYYEVNVNFLSSPNLAWNPYMKDNSRWLRCRAEMAWHIGGPYAHHQYSHRRCRNLRATVSRPSA